EAVVSTSAEHGALRTEIAMSELESGAGVVVEAANHAFVDGVGNSDRVEHRAHGGEVLAAGVVKILADLGELLDDGLVLGNLTVEHAQWVGLGATLAIGTHLMQDWL